MDRNVRLNTTYYRNFILLIVLPLLIVIGIALWFFRGNTLEVSRDRVVLAHHNIINALMQDVENAVLQFNHLLDTGDGELLDLSSRIFAAGTQLNEAGTADLQQFCDLILPPGSDIAAIHFYANNMQHFAIREPIAPGVSVRDIRSMYFYRKAMESPGDVFVSFVLPGEVLDIEEPLITVAFAVPQGTPASPTDTALICLYIPTRAYAMLQDFSFEPNQGEIYLLNEYSEIIMYPTYINNPRERIPDNIPWTTGSYPVTLAEGGQFSCIIRVIDDSHWGGWKLVSMVRDSVLLEDFNVLSLVVIIISILLFALYFVFSANFLKNIVTPLNKLIDGMQKMEQKMDNSEVKVYIEPVGQQEMRELIESFNYMTAHIGDLMRVKEGIFKASPVGLAMFNDEYKFIDCNETILTMFNVTKNDYFNNHHDLSPEYQPDGAKSRDKFIEIMKWALNGEQVVTEWLFTPPESDPIPCELTLTRTERGGKYIGLGFVYDLRSIKSMEQNIQFLESEVDKIYYDALTGIYNRRYFDKHLEIVMKTLSRTDGVLSLMMIDIDCFKLYNDTYGHSQGDECLKVVAQTLKETVTRTGDFVVRYGGEEFSVVLPNTDEEGARIVAEQLLGNIRSQNILHESTKVEGVDYITLSIGVTTGRIEYPYRGDDYIKRADDMLYQSKQSGRNKYTFGVLPPP
jgi:diguanylate cyclase (GGDEF)-like protein